MAFTVVTKSNVSGTVMDRLATYALTELCQGIHIPRLATPAVEIDPKPRKKGDTISVATLAALTASDKAENDEFSYQGTALGEVEISVNKHKESSVRIGGQAQLFSSAKLQEVYGRGLGRAVAKQVDTDGLAEYANAGSTVSSYGTTVSAAVMRTLRKAFSDAEAPPENRHACVATQVINELLAVSDFTKVNEYGSQAPVQVMTTSASAMGRDT